MAVEEDSEYRFADPCPPSMREVRLHKEPDNISICLCVCECVDQLLEAGRARGIVTCPLSKLDRWNTGRLRKIDNLLNAHGRGGKGGESQESLVVYKSFNILCPKLSVSVYVMTV